MSISRGATAQDFERCSAGVLDFVGSIRRDAYCVAGLHDEAVVCQCHQALTLSDMVELFTLYVLVQPSFLAGRDYGLGQALQSIAMDPGMHEFPNV